MNSPLHRCLRIGLKLADEKEYEDHNQGISNTIQAAVSLIGIWGYWLAKVTTPHQKRTESSFFFLYLKPSSNILTHDAKKESPFSFHGHKLKYSLIQSGILITLIMMVVILICMN